MFLFHDESHKFFHWNKAMLDKLQSNSIVIVFEIFIANLCVIVVVLQECKVHHVILSDSDPIDTPIFSSDIHWNNFENYWRRWVDIPSSNSNLGKVLQKPISFLWILSKFTYGIFLDKLHEDLLAFHRLFFSIHSSLDTCDDPSHILIHSLILFDENHHNLSNKNIEACRSCLSHIEPHENNWLSNMSNLLKMFILHKASPPCSLTSLIEQFAFLMFVLTSIQIPYPCWFISNWFSIFRTIHYTLTTIFLTTNRSPFASIQTVDTSWKARNSSGEIHWSLTWIDISIEE